jgi:peroxiredoxin
MTAVPQGMGVPQLSTIQDVTLKNEAGSTLTASMIWAGQPTVLYLIRRPGCGEDLQWRSSFCTRSREWTAANIVPSLLCKPCCVVLCREEAQNLQNAKPKLDAMGVKLVGIVKEWDEAEIKVLPVTLMSSCGANICILVCTIPDETSMKRRLH